MVDKDGGDGGVAGAEAFADGLDIGDDGSLFLKGLH